MKILPPLFHPILRTLAGVCCLGLFAAHGYGQTTWIHADPVLGGRWDVNEHWSTGTLPTGSTETRIDNGGWAQITNGDAVTRVFYVGYGTTGNRLSVAGHTLVTRAATIAWGAGSQGSVTIESGATLRTDGSGAYSAFHVGLGGEGFLDLHAGGKLLTGETTRMANSAGSNGTATIRGVWESLGNLIVGFNGEATLVIGSGGVVTPLGGTLSLANGRDASGSLWIGGRTAAEEAGRLNVGNVVGGAGTASLTFNHTNDDFIFETDAEHGSQAIVISGTTTVEIAAGTTTLRADSSYTGGTTVRGGTLLADNSGATSATGTGAVTVETAGRLGGNGRIAGSTLVAGSLLSGTGREMLTFGDTLALESQSVTQIGLDGVERGTSYDSINVTGELSLGGTLRITLLEGFSLEAGEVASFLIFDAASISGSFQVLELPEVWDGNELAWDTTMLGSAGRVSVVMIPEPHSFALLVGAGLLLLWGGRRHRIAR